MNRPAENKAVRRLLDSILRHGTRRFGHLPAAERPLIKHSRSGRCEAVYSPSADAPHEGPGWSGPLRCVLTPGHEGDRHWNSGINWRDPEDDDDLTVVVAKALHLAWCKEPGHFYGNDDFRVAVAAIRQVREARHA